jgi:hypothetical protein
MVNEAAHVVFLRDFASISPSENNLWATFFYGTGEIFDFPHDLIEQILVLHRLQITLAINSISRR